MSDLTTDKQELRRRRPSAEELENVILEESSNLLYDIESEIKYKFKRYNRLRTNRGTKGTHLENVVKLLLRDYLDSRFDFYNKAQIVDTNMDYLRIFEGESSELDIVATFKNAFPKIVAKLDSSYYVPYDAVAFYVEVKKSVNVSFLEKDLIKLDKLSKLKLNTNRFGGITGGHVARSEVPLRILFYFEIKVDENKLNELLKEHLNSWDVIIVLNKDQIIYNKQLPFGRWFIENTAPPEIQNEEFLIWENNCMIMLLIFISTSVPITLSVNTTSTFVNLMNYAEKNMQRKASN